MICQHLNEETCDLVSTLTKSTCICITEETCSACNSCTTPKSLNKITASLALVTLKKNKTFDSIEHKYLIDYCTKTDKVVGSLDLSFGTGTELAKLVSWFGKKDSRCDCDKHILKMNQWGPYECEKRIETITRWLKRSAIIHKQFYNRIIAMTLIRVAVVNSIIYCPSNKQSKPFKQY